mmetsp:Transcript_15154/g.17689  ORF Transcript_15154/g.17689 Transcript_15154/m.17689 type:complete len:206 (+) Transcript_15154:131-748(+)
MLGPIFKQISCRSIPGCQPTLSRAYSSSGDSIVDKVKEFFLFNPNQKPYVNYAKGTESVPKAYRTPAPMSRGSDIEVPIVEDTDELYNTQYYTRDTKRNNRDAIYVVSAEAKSLLPASAPEPTGSPGNNNPAVLRYDPDGTRSAMSTTTPAMQKVLAERASLSHVPQPWWAKQADSLKQESKEKGIPPMFGKPASWSKTEFDGKW